MVKNPPAMQETWVLSVGQEDPLEKKIATHSSTLTWKIPWMEESMGLLRVGHDWATSLSCIGEGNGNPLQCSCLENPRDGRAWQVAVSGVSQSRTRLKRLSSSSSRVSLTLQQFKILIFSNQPDFFFMASGFWVLLWKPFPAQEHYIYIDR